MADETASKEAGGWPDSAFWTYSLDLYGRDGIETACLSLQERRGIDVNLLLFALWLASRGVALDPTGVDEIENAIAGFRAEVVRPLRAVRRHLRRPGETKGSAIAADWPNETEELRRRVAAAELDAEHLIQLSLEQASAGFEGGHPEGAALAAGNLRLIASFDEADRADLAILLTRSFDGITGPELAYALQGVGIS